MISYVSVTEIDTTLIVVYSQLQRTNKRLNQEGGTNFIRRNRGPRGRPNMENRSRDKQGAQPGKRGKPGKYLNCLSGVQLVCSHY